MFDIVLLALSISFTAIDCIKSPPQSLINGPIVLSAAHLVTSPETLMTGLVEHVLPMVKPRDYLFGFPLNISISRFGICLCPEG